MCKEDCTCRRALRGQKSAVSRDVQIDSFDGKKVVVFDVVMAIADVVMNSSVFPEEEYFPDAWNDVPVTIGHPEQSDGSFLNAKLPEVIEQYAVGRLFKVRVDNGRLVGKAYIDIDKLKAKSPEALYAMTHGEPLDVSTGYFCTPEMNKGELKGKAYEYIARNVIPNHLALLPGDVGACSWKDGCGVKNKMTMEEAVAILNKVKVKKMPKPKKNDGSTPDKASVIAALIASADTPYEETDGPELEKLPDDLLAKIAQSVVKKNEDAPPVEDEEEEMNADGDEEPEKDKMKGKNKKVKQSAAPLSAEDKAALAFARKSYSEHRSGLVRKIVGNSKFVAKDLEDFSVDQLETMASKIEAPRGDYSGRGLPAQNSSDAAPIDDKVAAAFGNIGVVHSYKKA